MLRRVSIRQMLALADVTTPKPLSRSYLKYVFIVTCFLLRDQQDDEDKKQIIVCDLKDSLLLLPLSVVESMW